MKILPSYQFTVSNSFNYLLGVLFGYKGKHNINNIECEKAIIGGRSGNEKLKSKT